MKLPIFVAVNGWGEFIGSVYDPPFKGGYKLVGVRVTLQSEQLGGRPILALMGNGFPALKTPIETCLYVSLILEAAELAAAKYNSL
jgi:hypothetical protein